MNFDVMWVIITAGEEERDGREKKPERLAQGGTKAICEICTEKRTRISGLVCWKSEVPNSPPVPK